MNDRWGDSWAGWAQATYKGAWHQVTETRDGKAWFPCLARWFRVREVMDYRWVPPRRCRHVSCQKPGD